MTSFCSLKDHWSKKRKMIKSMRMAPDKTWMQRRLEVTLKDATHSYNHTESSSTGLKPAECNFPEFDPDLCSRLYRDRPLEKFKTLYTQTLKITKETFFWPSPKILALFVLLSTTLMYNFAFCGLLIKEFNWTSQCIYNFGHLLLVQHIF